MKTARSETSGVLSVEWLLPLFGAALVALLWWLVLDRIDNDRRVAASAARADCENVAASFEQRTLRAVQAADRTTLLIKYLFERDDAVDIGAVVSRGLIPRDAYLLTSLVDSTGRVVASSEPQAIGRYMGDRDYFGRHAHEDTGTVDISKPTLLRVSGKVAIQITRRLNRPDGSFAGIVLVSVDPDYFTAWYDDARLGRAGLLSLLGTDGVIRARRVGTTTQEASYDGTSRGVLAAAQLGPTGSYVAKSRIDGVERVWAYRKVSGLPLIVLAAQATDDVMARADERRPAYFMAAGAVTVLIVAFIAWTTYLTSRLKRSQRRAWKRAGELRLASTVFDTTADAIVLTDADDGIVMMNASCSTVFGISGTQSTGRGIQVIAGDSASDLQALREAANRDGRATGEIVRVDASGRPFYWRVTTTCVRDDSGAVVNYVRVFTDISALKDSQCSLERLARSDPLTGLLNRRAFYETLAAACAGDTWTSAGLLFLDIDDFKDLNDSFGHDAGDEALRQVARRLRECCRSADVISRIGGDEFTVLLPSIDTRAELMAAMERIFRAFEPPFCAGGHEMHLAVSIGAALYPTDAMDADGVVSYADEQMYRAKRTRKSDEARSAPQRTTC